MKIQTILAPNFPRPQVGINYRGLFLSRMIAALRVAIETVINDVIYSTDSRNAAAGYSYRTFLAGDTAQAQAFNSWPYWAFYEYTSVPHMPPYYPGSRLADWAENPYAAAKAIERRGTFGTYIFTDHWNAALPWIRTQLQLAAQAFLKEVLDFQGGTS